MRVPKWLVLVLTLALIAAACGDSDDTTSDEVTEDTSEVADTSETTEAAATDDSGSTDDGGSDDGGDSTDPAPSEASGDLRYAVPLGAGSFDPHAEARDFAMLYYAPIYDGLVNELPDNTLVPGLATEWEISPTEARFTLREGVSFHDGTPFDAEAVKWNIEKVKATPGGNAALLATIDTVDVVSPTEVVFNMTGPDRDLLLNLARFPGLMISPAAPPDAVAAGAVAAGTGPYMLTDRNESEIVMEPNSGYWNPDDQGLNSVTFVVLTDDEARLNALLTGEVDVATVRVFQEEPAAAAGFAVDQTVNNVAFLHFHDIGGNIIPEFADPRVRQAIAHLVNREAWGQVVTRGVGSPTNQVFQEGSPWHLDGYEGYPHDPERAIELLNEAGVTDLTFEAPSWGLFNAFHQTLAAMLAEGGITMTIRDIQPGGTVAEVAQRQAPATVTLISTLHPDQVFGTWLSPPTVWNPFDVAVPEVIGPFQAAAGAASEAEADAAYRDMLQAAYDLAFIVPIYLNEGSTAYDSDKFDIVPWENITIGISIRGLTAK